MKETFRPKIDWWIYLVLAIMVGGCFFGPLSEGAFAAAVILSLSMLGLWLFAVLGVMYEIRGGQLGIRKFYRWTWIPIDKISEVERMHGVYVQGAVSATLSLSRVRLRLSDSSILRSAMPVDISPKDSDGFIRRLKEINPGIVEK